MSERQIEQILQAISDYCDAQDAATQTLRNQLKGIHSNNLKPAATITPQPQKKEETVLTPELDAKLDYTRRPDGVLFAKLKHFEPDHAKWAAINAELLQIGGKYISAGKDSGWELP